MFDRLSRYAPLTPYAVKDRRGRTVLVVLAAEDPQAPLLGYHLRREGQSLDHLASHYLGDAAGFWRICEAAGVMLPEALSEAREIPIPGKRG